MQKRQEAVLRTGRGLGQSPERTLQAVRADFLCQKRLHLVPVHDGCRIRVSGANLLLGQCGGLRGWRRVASLEPVIANQYPFGVEMDTKVSEETGQSSAVQ